MPPRSDGAHHTMSSRKTSLGRGSLLSRSSSRSASPIKNGGSRQQQPIHRNDSYEEVETIEDADGPYEQDQKGSDIECLDPLGRSHIKAQNHHQPYTSMADRTRGRSKPSSGSASPTKPVAGHTDTKGKGKASVQEIFGKHTVANRQYATRQSAGSTSPPKPEWSAAPFDKKGKGKADNDYVEIDNGQKSSEDEDEFSHLLTIDATKKTKAIPSSGLQTDTSLCNTRVVRCTDRKDRARRMWVWQVELHADGISLGDSKNWKESKVFIQKSSMIETQVCLFVFRYRIFADFSEL
jgi:hypothetical protein